MGFYDKPYWWNKPVVTQRRVVIALVIVLMVFAVNIAVAVYQSASDDFFGGPMLYHSLGLALVRTYALMFIPAWFFGMFFLARTTVSLSKLKRYPSSGILDDADEGFWNRLLGVRRRDLSPESLVYRELAIDGFIGTALTFGTIFGLKYLAALSGFGAG